MTRLPRRAALAGAAWLALLGARRDARALYQGGEDAFTVMVSDARFRDWVGIIVQAGLADFLRGSLPFTMFAPVNEAFAPNPNFLQELLPNASERFPDAGKLIQLVRSHMLYGLHPVSEFGGKRLRFTSAAATPITIDGTNPQSILVQWTSVNGQMGTARLRERPEQCANALIYPMDRVILRSY